MLGLTLAQWIAIVEAAPTILAALDKAGPALMDLLKAVEGLTSSIKIQGGTTADVASFLTTTTTTDQWNAWAAQMRPDLVVPTSSN